MKIAANAAASIHAPANSRVACTCAYVAGADVLRLPVRLTKDERAVVAEHDDIAPLTGEPATISQMTLAELRQLNCAAMFKDSSGHPFKAPAMKIETFAFLLDVIPNQPWILVELKSESNAARRSSLVKQVVSAAQHRALLARMIVYSSDADTLSEIRTASPHTLIASYAPHGAGIDQLEGGTNLDSDSVVLRLSDGLDRSGAKPKLTAVGSKIVSKVSGGKLPLGAILIEDGSPIDPAAYALLSEGNTFWAVITDSVITAGAFRPAWKWVDEHWEQSAANHEDVNADLWHLGYAKYNPEHYCHVYPDKGIHIDIKEFTGDVTYKPTHDPIRDQLQHLLERTWESSKDWPFYSGGGVAFAPGIEGDFSAEVDVESVRAQQATTVEMAAINVDPATHRKPWIQNSTGAWEPNYPASFRDKHTCFDPHGAPPFCGVEHDEDDGWRINWNTGTDYDSNQYGKPWGDGKLLKGRMRLDRRGEWFAAYFRPTDKTGDRDWICIGVARNESLNPRIYLRLSGKRWRQEDPENPSRWMPVIPNHFVFRNMTITRYVTPPHEI